MRKIYVVGTVHSMLPKARKELDSILEKINPDQVLVEIESKDIKKKRFLKYPKEMRYVYRWAIKKNKKVDGFDIHMKIVKKPLSKATWKAFWKEANKLIHKGWKELNKKKYRKQMSKFEDLVIDPKKDIFRERIMVRNIRKKMIRNGKVLILTGCGHLAFFEKQLKRAIFPLK